VGVPAAQHKTEEDAMAQRIGFIGIGLMGHGMAKNLLAKGFGLTFFVRKDRDDLADVLAAGVKKVTTDAGAVAQSD
jgi:3-hydroxyisobutyrate dehydrogenase-like beta-hydroxyacid dehydrogenase